MLLPQSEQILLLAADGNAMEDGPSLPLSGEFNPHDWSWVAGLSLSWIVGQQEFVFDARYFHNFSDWRTGDAEEPQLRSQVLVFSVGVLW